MARHLLSHPYDLTVENYRGFDAIALAVQYNHHDIVSLLSSYEDRLSNKQLQLLKKLRLLLMFELPLREE
jgi:hypothetical protein